MHNLFFFCLFFFHNNLTINVSHPVFRTQTQSLFSDYSSILNIYCTYILYISFFFSFFTWKPSWLWACVDMLRQKAEGYVLKHNWSVIYFVRLKSGRWVTVMISHKIELSPSVKSYMLHLTGENDWMLSALVWTPVTSGGKETYAATKMNVPWQTSVYRAYFTCLCLSFWLCYFTVIATRYLEICSLLLNNERSGWNTVQRAVLRGQLKLQWVEKRLYLPTDCTPQTDRME